LGTKQLLMYGLAAPGNLRLSPSLGNPPPPHTHTVEVKEKNSIQYIDFMRIRPCQTDFISYFDRVWKFGQMRGVSCWSLQF
jgi:hypothetical protein